MMKEIKKKKNAAAAIGISNKNDVVTLYKPASSACSWVG